MPGLLQYNNLPTIAATRISIPKNPTCLLPLQEDLQDQQDELSEVKWNVRHRKTNTIWSPSYTESKKQMKSNDSEKYFKETAKHYDLTKPYGWIYGSEVKMLVFESQFCALLAINLP